MRSLSRQWASLFTEVFFITTVALSAAMAVVGHCPRSLDCARERRHFCQPGSSHCGPCLDPFVENKRGKCVVRRRNHSAKVNYLPELDEEIDVLSAIISSKHKESEMKHSAPSPAAPKVTEEDHSLQSSRFRAAPSPTSTTPEKPLTSALPTSSFSTISPASHTPINSAVHNDPFIVPYPSEDHSFIIYLGVFIMAGSVAMVLTGLYWVRMQRGNRLYQKVDYPAFGLRGPHSYDVAMPGDKTLAQSAQMYHFHLQKQQMMSLKQRKDSKILESGATSDEENEDGDFTVYECPGLAPTGEMEVKNPLFDDSTFHLHLQRSYN
ncbi:neural proliferation differentiation and control protein 1-like isoform X2 [Xyrauchen texanus]|uniref:neural proliferation differentiation and control protein 1-like isoform X2 n=1 Tax=Xyrauchen texanus TaxID=154827 RepID=UPI002241E33A|nr:neural proliferation differentiation and control protein 1-like isoform X2 [Xyrauchen texanus]